MTAVSRLDCPWTELYEGRGAGLLWQALQLPVPTLASGRRVPGRRDHGPLGVTAVLVTVLPAVTGCLVQVEEDFVAGPGLELPRPVRTLALERANQRALHLVATQLAGPSARSPRPLPPPVRDLLARRPQPSFPVLPRPTLRVPPRPSRRVRVRRPLPLPPRPSFTLPARPALPLPPRPSFLPARPSLSLPAPFRGGRPGLWTGPDRSTDPPSAGSAGGLDESAG